MRRETAIHVSKRGSVELAERHRIEQVFHDRAAGHERTDFYAWGALNAADDYALARLGDLRGQTVLDLGCGDGANALRLAARGALVHAIDISSGMAEATQARAAAAGFGGVVHAQQMSAEYLAFADGTFDAIYGHSVLHHTDLSITRREIARVLRPGGRAVFLEPLDHNPVLNLFRRLTPWRRTPTEKPLSYGEVRFFGEPFAELQYREFYLAALAAFACLPLGQPQLFQVLMRRLGALDETLFAHWPRLRRYAWVIVLELVNKK